MICLRCDNEKFVARPDAVVEQEFKGELLHVTAPAAVCTKCGWVSVSADQVDELRRRTADAYRRKHGLLTSDAIRAFREVLEMNQRQFAVFLGVGEASVKRWETWLVQERSSDQLIRLKCREALANTAPGSQALAQEQFEIDPAVMTAYTASGQETLDVPRWTIPTATGPPQCCDSVAFSLSVPHRGTTLKKKMLTQSLLAN
jgi:putative zinc finger/helix-turn-helix YgiT family protein